MKQTIYKTLILAAVMSVASGCSDGTLTEEPAKSPAPVVPVAPVKPIIEQPPKIPSVTATAAEVDAYLVALRAYCARHPSLAYCS